MNVGWLETLRDALTKLCGSQRDLMTLEVFFLKYFKYFKILNINF